jgi:polyribonucleotide nucleotidyltransferase
MSKILEFNINNLKEVYQLDKVANQANGGVLLKERNSVILATVCAELDNPIDGDFIPMTVQYIEKHYAAGKFPNGFIKREARPSEFETLTSRLIDRSLRPLFPEGYCYNTVVNILVLSADSDSDLQVLALNAASAALYLSDLPINKLIHGVRVSEYDNNFSINAPFSKQQHSSMDLYVSGTKDELVMIEMKSINSDNNICIEESKLIKAISLASEAINEANISYLNEFNMINIKKSDIELIKNQTNSEIFKYIEENHKEEVNSAVRDMAKSERNNGIKKITQSISLSKLSLDNNWEINKIKQEVLNYKKIVVRDMILNKQKRADGRNLDEIRDITIDTNILPNAHSSCLFTRGQTQALVIGTLGGIKDSQIYDLLTNKEQKNENFMVHYNFPGFSVGEASIISGVSRRELGHGNLAKRALESSIDTKFDSTIRLVSEILESNGSSSMATVCAGSIALKCAKIPTIDMISGVAMGVVIQGDRKEILTDITGLEDQDGDMDLKVAGTANGITALQMDIKLGGVDIKLLSNMLEEAKKARIKILSKMNEAIENITFNKSLPTTELFNIDASAIFHVIGAGGKTIKDITSKYDVEINLNRDNGDVKLSSKDKEAMLKVKSLILEIASKNIKLEFNKLYKIDEEYTGVVKRITNFGAFVELPKGGEGLLHVSKLSNQRVEKVTDIIKLNEEINVTVIALQKDKMELCLSSILE